MYSVHCIVNTTRDVQCIANDQSLAYLLVWPFICRGSDDGRDNGGVASGGDGCGVCGSGSDGGRDNGGVAIGGGGGDGKCDEEDVVMMVV